MFYLMESLALALKNLSRYKLRSFLATLGIVFGIAAVVSMMSVGAGAHSEVIAQIHKLGTRNIILSTAKPPEEKKASGGEQATINQYGLTFRDAEYLQTILPSDTKVLRIHRARKKVYYKSRAIEAKILGVEPDYFRTLNVEVSSGRHLYFPDYPQARRVCVVGAGLLKELLYIGDPLKLSLRIGSDAFLVVGIIGIPDTVVKSSALSEGESLNVYIPFSTSLKRFGTFSVTSKTGSWEISQVELEQIVVSCKDVEQVMDTALIIASVLKNFHEKRDYEIVVPMKQLQQVQKTQQIFQIVMILIASISLLVGGIGIANIMFATVTERTKEIGIRRALGARRRDIRLQFLCETIVIAIVGGILGCALGMAGIYGIQQFTGWQVQISFLAMSGTLLISCVVGILSGFAPAHTAAKGNPVTALRHE